MADVAFFDSGCAKVEMHMQSVSLTSTVAEVLVRISLRPRDVDVVVFVVWVLVLVVAGVADGQVNGWKGGSQMAMGGWTNGWWMGALKG